MCMYAFHPNTNPHTHTHTRMEKQILSICFTPWILLTLNQLRSVFSCTRCFFLEKFQLLRFSTNSSHSIFSFFLRLYSFFSRSITISDDMLFLFPGRFNFIATQQWRRTTHICWTGMKTTLEYVGGKMFNETDNNINWFVENSPSLATGSSGTENRSLLRIWCSCVNFIDGNICIDRPLVSLHMVCYTHYLSNMKSNRKEIFPRNILFRRFHSILTGTPPVQFISGDELVNNDISIQFQSITTRRTKLFARKLYTVFQCPCGIR